MADLDQRGGHRFDEADRASQLQAIADLELVYEVGRYLTSVDALDRDRHPAAVGRRRDRIASLSLVTVVGGQPDVHVLAGLVPRPIRAVEHKAAHPGGLVYPTDDLTDQPGQSPA